MRLTGFKIKNIKSIKDTGWCHLSASDNITVLAGQNEAGKSAILEGLNFFRNGSNSNFERLSKRIDEHPYVECEFQLEEDDWQSDNEDIDAVLAKFSLVKFYRGDTTKEDFDSIKLLKETEDSIRTEVDLYAVKKNPQILNQIIEENIHPEPLINEGVQTPVSVVSVEELDQQINTEELKKTIATCLIEELLPEFIFYDSFNNILPGTVKVNDIDNFPAIKDFQKVFSINFIDEVGKDPRARSSTEFTLNKNATIDLNSYWKQRQTTLNDDEYEYAIRILPNTTDPNLSIIEFLIHRNDGTPLYMEQKSKGFQWFSSFNLRLKALGVDL